MHHRYLQWDLMEGHKSVDVEVIKENDVNRIIIFS
jgi:hypothetical protein